MYKVSHLSKVSQHKSLLQASEHHKRRQQLQAVITEHTDRREEQLLTGQGDGLQASTTMDGSSRESKK